MIIIRHKGIRSIGILALLFLFTEFVLRVTLYRIPEHIENIPAIYRADKAPPWLYRRDSRHQIDADLIWTPKPGYKRKGVIPSGKDLWGENGELELYELTVNSRGFRGKEFFLNKGKDTFRIVTLGDSWTFGERVNDQHTYPKKLEDFLNIEFPNRNIEVLNLGTSAYTSLQGLKLFQKKVLELDPDLVILGFNTNDARKTYPAYKNDTHMLDSGRKTRMKETLLRYSKVMEIGVYYLRKFQQSKNPQVTTAKSGKPWWDYSPRNTAEKYKDNISEIVRSARRNNIDSILLHTAGYYPYNFVLSQLLSISGEEDVLLVNTQPAFHKRLKEVQREIEKRFDLEPEKNKMPFAKDGKEEIIFRVYFPEEKVSSSLRPEGRPVLNVIIRTVNKLVDLPLFDDGTHGDQKPNDHVWSTTYRFSPVEQHRVVEYVDEDGTSFRATFLYYVYTFKSVNGRVYYELYGESAINDPSRTHNWRTILIDPRNNEGFVPFDYSSPDIDQIYTPVHTFWHKDYTSDHIGHPNGEGYQLIAHKLFKAIKSSRLFTAYLERSRGNTLN